MLGTQTRGGCMEGADESTEFTLYNVNSACFFKYGPIPASFSFIFVLFTSHINYKLKKRRCCAWDSNQGQQDGRRRRNHRAMAATLVLQK